MNPNFFHLKDTTGQSDDKYGDRLKIALEPIPSVVPLGSPLSVRVKVSLDGEPIPLVPFPKNDQGEFDFSDYAIPTGAAIGAAVVIRDIQGDLDFLQPIELKAVAHGVLGGDDANVTKESRSLLLKVVVKMRTRSVDVGHAQFPRCIRTELTSFRVGDQVQQNAPADVWLVEYVSSFGSDFYKAKIRRLNVDTNESLIVDSLNLPTINGVPTNFRINRNGLSAPSDVSGLLVAHSEDSFGNTRQLVYIDNYGTNTNATLDVHDSPVSKIDAVKSNARNCGWVAGDNRLVYLYPELNIVQRTIENVQASALADAMGGVWAAVKTSGKPNVHLMRYSCSPNVIDDVEVPELSNIGILTIPHRWMLLQAMADNGVICYANYRAGNRLVRVNWQGRIVAFGSDQFINVVEMGVNPYLGTAVVVHVYVGRTVLTTFDSALEKVKTFQTSDPIFENNFVEFHSADISATKNGTRLWITGARHERDRGWAGAVGYLDEDEQFHLVLGGLGAPTFVRALIGGD